MIYSPTHEHILLLIYIMNCQYHLHDSIIKKMHWNLKPHETPDIPYWKIFFGLVTTGNLPMHFPTCFQVLLSRIQGEEIFYNVLFSSCVTAAVKLSPLMSGRWKIDLKRKGRDGFSRDLLSIICWKAQHYPTNKLFSSLLLPSMQRLISTDAVIS